MTVLIALTCFSQSKDEKKMLGEANGHFKEKEYLVAEKFYAQLCRSNPKNAEYNFKYGACLLYTQTDKSEALRYLKLSVKQNSEVVDPFYFLGRAYQYNYYFEEALNAYQKFQTRVSSRIASDFEIDALIDQCKTGMKLIKDFNQVKILSSKQMKRRQFFRAYKLGDMKRKVLVKPNEFKNKEDFLKKNGKNPDPFLIVFNKKDKNVFFSGSKYGNRFAVLERDIYFVTRDSNDIWSDFQDVGPFINTDYDEDFPYLHPNGKELYFSSKGHGGLGGYDIFKSELDTVTNLWGRPINLGFSINSPYDDFLYVADENNEVAYFASNRKSPEGEVTVYKIAPEEFNDNYVLFKGNVKSELGGSNKMKIEVINSDEQIVANYESDKKTGDFLFPLGELESYQIRFTDENGTVKKLKVTMPLKDSQAAVNYRIKVKANPKAPLEKTVDNSYQMTPEDEVENYRMLALIEKNQARDLKFGVSKIEELAGADETEKDDEKTRENELTELTAALQDIQDEKKLLLLEVDAAYASGRQKNQEALILDQELKTLKTSTSSDNKEGIELIEEKQKAYNNKVKQLVQTVQYAKDRENSYLSKNKEEEITLNYIGAVGAANSGEDIDLLAYREQYENKKLEITADHKRNGGRVNSSIIKAKNDRSQLLAEEFKLESDLALIDDVIEYLTKQMNETKRDKKRTELAIRITELEKEKKKKRPLLAEKKELIAELDQKIDEDAQKISLYSYVDQYAVGPDAQRVNLGAKKKITRDIRSTIDNSIYAGKMGNFSVRDIKNNESAFEISFVAGQDFTASEEDLALLFSANINEVSEDEIKRLSNSIFGINRAPENGENSEETLKNERLATNDFREALLIRQQIERKKAELAAATSETEKEIIRNEIALLEEKLYRLENKAITSLMTANDSRFKDKNKKLEQALQVNPSARTKEVDALFKEIKIEWDKISALRRAQEQAKSNETKVKLGKEILSYQVKTLKKQNQLEQIIKGEPTSEDLAANDSPISFGDSKNTIRNSQGEIDYGPNSTMRITKGLLIGSDIKYNIKTIVPIDIPLGSGLVYKIQVGAFRNKINPAMFNGMTPLSGESVGNGITRYTAGWFQGLQAAKMAKGKIVSMGYSDAFIVAFYNGVRISLDKSEDYIANSTKDEQKLYAKNEKKEVKALLKIGIKKKDALITKSKVPNPIDKFKALTSSGKTIAKGKNSTIKTTDNSNDVDGTYFTVQIGVFSSPKSKAQLYNISPIRTYPINGVLKYTTGVFRNLDQANKRKQEVIAQGATDAYIVAYRNGKRISIEEAQNK